VACFLQSSQVDGTIFRNRQALNRVHFGRHGF
jgi:hypothetical protein